MRVTGSVHAHASDRMYLIPAVLNVVNIWSGDGDVCSFGGDGEGVFGAHAGVDGVGLGNDMHTYWLDDQIPMLD